MSSSLTDWESEKLKELIQIAPLGSMGDWSLLNEEQKTAAIELNKKGYVGLYHRKFIVLLAPPGSNPLSAN